MRLIYTALALLIVAALDGCSGKKPVTVMPEIATELKSFRKNFNPDSAYRYVARQLECGPRNPGSEGHAKCVEYIKSQLQAFGVDTVMEQRAQATVYTGRTYPLTNIIARINPLETHRVILGAHYDTRPWADNEQVDSLRNRPIPGANDGGSGVAVLLEIARNLAKEAPEIGVDLVFFDLEDHGRSDSFGDSEETWCLGSQYFAKHLPYGDNNLPVYGVIFDMVGGRDAVFHREYMSNRHAPQMVDKIWSRAAHSEYASRFINSVGGAIVDDHMPLNNAGIPTVDIVECNNRQTGSFPPTWHKQSDDLSNIDPATLKAVGQTVLDVIYNEKKTK